ncbi:MAG TPA: ArsA family ATPase [Candidatus Angelobacter sp.]|nr:ArsA family ATPase [Candidatus Angelobacter sp.]
MSRLTFVVGKGGVGKTTVACALALHEAARHPRSSVLLMSTDPAHSLGDTLWVRLGSTPKKLSGAPGTLYGWQIDSEREFRKFLAGNRGAILDIVERGTLFSKEEIAPLLDTTLPGMAEVAALLAIQELLENDKYGHIVIDTAPFGHTLRLFELPTHFERFLDFLNVASGRDAWLAARFGGRTTTPAESFIQRWQAAVNQVKQAFGAKDAEVLLVTTPEIFSLNEAARSLRSLRKSVPEMKLSGIVLNRAVAEPGSCPHCRRRAQMTRRAERWLKAHFARVPLFRAPDPGNPLLGVALLRRFGDAVFESAERKLTLNAPRSTKIKATETEWPIATTPLSFTVGKGGVGKTTVTAALAFRTRKSSAGIQAMVCSTDPAPSLDDVFQKKIGDEPVHVLKDRGLHATEFDSVAEYRKWARHIRQRLDTEFSMQSGGLHLDLTFEKQIFAALMEVVPPGVDEVFAIFRVLELLESGRGKVLIDMAPTGHALELLRMPERMLLWSRLLLKSLSAHRTLALAQDVAVELASLGQRVRRLIQLMRDQERSRVWAVMLAEPVPDSQTRRLLDAVEQIGIRVDSLFVNRVLLDYAKCPRCARGQGWQAATLARLQQRYGKHRIYLVAEFPDEIAGAAALKNFTGRIWQIAE